MEVTAIRTTTTIGLVVAVALHTALAVGLYWLAKYDPPQRLAPPRMTVSLATEVSLESTSPDPVPESRAAIAPSLSDTPAPEQEIAPEETAPQPQPTTAPTPPPRRNTTRQTSRTPPPERERSRPDRTPRPTPSPTRSARRSGGSLIGDNFLEGQGGATNTDERRIPASEIGRSAQASLRQAINRQIKPHWSAPNGVDAERLVSIASWRLNEDGSLRGSPRCRTNPDSITDSNRSQSALHCERAIRAIRQAAPFDLPDEYYEGWKNITSWRFDRRL